MDWVVQLGRRVPDPSLVHMRFETVGSETVRQWARSVPDRGFSFNISTGSSEAFLPAYRSTLKDGTLIWPKPVILV